MCRFQTSRCVGPKRFRVYRQNARMCSTCARFASTHGGVLNRHMETFGTYTRGGFPRAKPRHTHHTHHTAHTTHTPRTHATDTTHRTLHTNTSPNTSTNTSTPQHQNTKRTSHTHSQHIHHRTHHTHTNAWICAPRSTDHDLALDKESAISATSVILCGFIVLELIKNP